MERNQHLSGEWSVQYTHDKVPYWTSCRVYLSVIGMIGFIFVYLLRINMSVAIICMVGSTQHSAADINATGYNTSAYTSYNNKYAYDGVNENNVSYPEGNLTSQTNCGDDLQAKSSGYKGEFSWNKQMVGYILSSFFYGYIITQIPGGWLAGRYGGKHVFGVGMLVCILATLLAPVAARLHAYFFIVLRVIAGMATGVVFPAMHAMWGKWAPPLERSKLMAFCYSGTMVGTVFAMSFSGYFCTLETDNGWPLIFYVYGAAAFVWWIVWVTTVHDTPSQHPRITLAELAYIEQSIGKYVYEKQIRTPVLQIMKSPAVWAIIVAHACNNYGGYTILTSIPMYMKEVLHFDVKKNGMLSALPYITSFFAVIAVSQLADYIRTKRLLSTKSVRKLFQFLAFSILACFIIIMGFMGCQQRWTAVTLLIVAVTSTSLGRSGYSINHVDISPKFAGFLFGLSNTAATIPGMVAPIIMGALTPDGTQEEWQKVFFICGAVYLFGAVFYVIFAQGEEQRWTYDEETPKTPAQTALKLKELNI